MNWKERLNNIIRIGEKVEVQKTTWESCDTNTYEGCIMHNGSKKMITVKQIRKAHGHLWFKPTICGNWIREDGVEKIK